MASKHLRKVSENCLLADLAKNIISDKSELDEISFFLIDLDDIKYKYELWKQALPHVIPHYAVKANGETVIIRTLATLGVNFDCATRGEVSKVLAMGVTPDRIVYSHTVKAISFLKYIREVGVTKMTFDNAFELQKIKEHYPDAALILRLKVVKEDRYNMCDKFGASLEEAKELLAEAKRLSLRVVGLSFHAGSNNQREGVFTEALNICKEVEKIANGFGFNITIIDIGGGFLGYLETRERFKKITNEIQVKLNESFPKEEYHVISEPGTYFVASSTAICAKIIGKKIVNGTQHLYVNDSVYMSFIESTIGDSHYVVQNINEPTMYSADNDKSGDDDLLPTRLWGNTCDGTDLIISKRCLPKWQIGDWLLFYNTGAYSMDFNTNFHSCQHPDRYFISRNSEMLDQVAVAIGQ